MEALYIRDIDPIINRQVKSYKSNLFGYTAVIHLYLMCVVDNNPRCILYDIVKRSKIRSKMFALCEFRFY